MTRQIRRRAIYDLPVPNWAGGEVVSKSLLREGQ